MWWIHNRLSKGVRKVIPSCVLWSICKKYPSADGSYIPFKESRYDEARQLYGDNWCTLWGLNFRDPLDLRLPNFRRCYKINPLRCRHTTSHGHGINVEMTSCVYRVKAIHRLKMIIKYFQIYKGKHRLKIGILKLVVTIFYKIHK